MTQIISILNEVGGESKIAGGDHKPPRRVEPRSGACDPAGGLQRVLHAPRCNIGHFLAHLGAN